jgi:predicted Fe-Mo cluster-binding NifX family protein
MTKAAFSVWDERIAPVFDVARQLLLVEGVGGGIISETGKTFDDDFYLRKALILADLGIDVLICGAISRPLAEAVAAYGIRVIPFVAGEVHEVKGAWLSGRLDTRRFAMPGCCGRRRGWKTAEVEMEEYVMRGNNCGGRGRGGGMGKGGQGRGRAAGASVAGPGGNCVCPACGHIEPHEAGVPCMGKQCPKCGKAMVRE